MAPPTFNDVGKSFKDVYNKQFPAGFIKLIAKLPETNRVGLSFDGSYKMDDGVTSSNLESKALLKIFGTGVTWTEKWTAKNEISTNFEIKPTKDVVNGLEFLFNPSKRNSSIKLKNVYKSDAITASGDIFFKSLKPEISLSVMSNINWLSGSGQLPLQGGGSLTLDTSKSQVSSMGYGLQLDRGDVCLSATVTNNTDFMSQLFCQLSPICQLAWETGWSSNSRSVRFGGAVQYHLQSGSVLKARITSCGQLSLAYCFQVFYGIKLSLGSCIKTKSINAGGHQFGLQVDI